jgi:hypothetical protein
VPLLALAVQKASSDFALIRVSGSEREVFRRPISAMALEGTFAGVIRAIYHNCWKATQIRAKNIKT